MNFSLNEVQTMLADSIAKFINDDYDFETRQKNADSILGYSEKTWRTFAELGWTAVPFSEQDGGFDGGPVDMMVVMEQLGRGLIVEPYLANIVLAGGVLRRAADTRQKQRWLAALISGDLQATLAFAEPQSRFELGNISSMAKNVGDSWLVNGRKSYVLSAENAELIIVPARTAGAQTDRDGITLFAIPSDVPGMTRRAYKTIDGLRAAEIELQDVCVTQDQRLGEVGGGFVTLQSAVFEATFAVCAEAVGIMTILTQKTIEYSKSRTQFGVPIGSFQALQHRMVDMYTACEQSRSLLMWAAMMLAEGDEIPARVVHTLKYQIGTAATRVGEEAVQIHGGMGVTWELDVAHYFKRLTAINVMFGNADWHLERLAATTDL